MEHLHLHICLLAESSIQIDDTNASSSCMVVVITLVCNVGLARGRSVENLYTKWKSVNVLICVNRNKKTKFCL